MSYNNSAFENIDKGCPASAKINLGQIIDIAYTNLKNGETYSGDVLTGEQVEILDKMCSASDITDIAYVLNNILTASKEQGTVDELSEEIIYKINNGICGIFQSCELGNKLEEMIEAVNNMSDDSVADFSTFAIGDYDGAIDKDGATVSIEVPYGTDISNSIATFTFINNKSTAKVGLIEQESGVTANDFSNPVTYTITAPDGMTTKDYTVIVTIAPAPYVQLTQRDIQNLISALGEEVNIESDMSLEDALQASLDIAGEIE